MEQKLGKISRDADGKPYVPNVLIVEDDDTTRVILKMFLSKIGFDVRFMFEADNGLKGLQLLKEKSVDLILTDINMPVMDGLKMLNRIGEDPEFDSIPGIVVSSEKDTSLIDTVISKGYGFVRKPFTINAIEYEILNLDSLKNADYVQG